MDPMKAMKQNLPFRRAAALLLALMLCCAGGLSASAESTPWLEAECPVREGDRSVSFRVDSSLTDLRINIFAGEEDLAESAERVEETLTVTLKRVLKAEEALTVMAEGLNAAGEKLECRLSLEAEGLFQTKLSALRKRADEMWPVWWDNWRVMMEDGTIYLPGALSRVPFMTWPDEAPSLAVTEEEGRGLFRFSESVPEGWTVCVGAGLPVEYTPCEWDEDAEAWTAEAGYESVWLISSMEEARFGISIEYPAVNGWLPEYPRLEWDRETETGVWAMNCYGWGNARSFSGAMLALVNTESQWYAEYDSEGAMIAYYALHLGCQFDAEDHLIDGTLPEDYVSPVIH